MTVALPKDASLVEKGNLVAYFQNGVHVVGVDHRSHVELLGQIADETVNEY